MGKRSVSPDWTRWQSPVQKVVVEGKGVHKSLGLTLTRGPGQITNYMDTCGTNEGQLVILSHILKNTRQ